MKITWVTRSFLDYRVPVYGELDRLCEKNLVLVCPSKWTPERAMTKVANILGDRLVVLDGEVSIGTDIPEFANSSICLPYQPGLIKAVRKTNPDVLVSDGFFQWTYAPLWIRATKKVPHVMCYERTFHTERSVQWYRLAYRKFVSRWIDAICCNGSLCGDYVRSLGYPAEQLTFGHMVADTAGLYDSVLKVSVNEVKALRQTLRAKGHVFLYVGRLIKRKGVAELLRAWTEFTLDFTGQVTLVLVGDGPERQDLESYAATNGLDNVIFTGTVDYDSIAQYYKLADVFVISTLEDNWSLVVPEAMACGLPVMCSQYNGCHPELITPENGWVFDPLNEEDTTARLLDVVNSKDRFVNMGQVSKRIIDTGHTPKHAAQAVYDACRIAILHNRRKYHRRIARS